MRIIFIFTYLEIFLFVDVFLSLNALPDMDIGDPVTALPFNELRVSFTPVGDASAALAACQRHEVVISEGGSNMFAKAQACGVTRLLIGLIQLLWNVCHVVHFDKAREMVEALGPQKPEDWIGVLKSFPQYFHLCEQQQTIARSQPTFHVTPVSFGCPHEGSASRRGNRFFRDTTRL